MLIVRLCRCCKAPVDYKIFKCTYCGQFYSRFSQLYYENEKYLKDNNITDIRERKDEHFDMDFMTRGQRNSGERAQDLFPILFSYGLNINHISGGSRAIAYLMFLESWTGYYPVRNVVGLINYIPVFEDEFSAANVLTIAYEDKTIRRIILQNLY